MIPTHPQNGFHHPAKVNARHLFATAKALGLTRKEVKELLSGGKLGRAVPEEELTQITKGFKLKHWAILNRQLQEFDRKLKTKDLPSELFLALQQAKTQVLSELFTVTKELGEISTKTASNGHNQLAPHSFGPREQIGNVTAVQVNIGKAPDKAPVTDVNRDPI